MKSYANSILICIFLSLTFYSQAQNILSYKTETRQIVLQAEKGNIFIQPYRSNIIRITGFNNTIHENTDAIFCQPEVEEFEIKETPNGINLTTDSLMLVIDFHPFKIEFQNQQKDYLTSIDHFQDHQDTCGFQLKLRPREMIFGLGERAVSINRRGNVYKLNNEGHWGYGWGELNLNYSVPHFISSNNYSIFLDNGGIGKADVGKTVDSLMQVEVAAENFNLFFLYNSTQQDLQKNFSKLTGTQSMPPRWAFGNLMSRFGYESQADATNKLDSMLAAGYPVDAIILDLYWFGKGREDWMMGELDWYEPNWPSPQKMIDDFKKKGVQTVLITEPYVLNTSSKYESGKNANAFALDTLGNEKIIHDFFFGQAGLIDVFSVKGKNWFWQYYNKQIANGIAGWWGDLGEPERFHDDIQFSIGKGIFYKNLFGHYWSKMVFENYSEHFPNQRLFHLNRAGFAGSQRYSSFPWSGDVSRTWGGLKAQLPNLISMNMSGIPYIHSDLGGFCNAPKNEELYLRWLQFGVFNPIFRPHSENVPSEAIYYSDSIQKYVKPSFELRYQLLPYHYTMAWKQQYFNEPMATPLFFKNDVPKTLMNITDEYMWGDAFLVAPVTKPGQKVKTVFLPKGIWFDFFTGERHFGNSNVQKKLTLEHIPVFVKAGSFVPMTKPIQSTAFYKSDTIAVHFYFDISVTESKTVIYEDDGKLNNAYDKNEFELTSIDFKRENEKLFFTLKNEGFEYIGRPATRVVNLLIHGINNSMKSVTIDLSKNSTKSITIEL